MILLPYTLNMFFIKYIDAVIRPETKTVLDVKD